MTLLALSRYVSFHARGDAAFVWHGLTGDVAEMSRDVLALLLAFDPPADEAKVIQDPPAGLGKEQVQEFAAVLRSRRFLVHAGAGGKAVDEISPLLAGVPRIPRATVFERRGGEVAIYTRAGEALQLDPVTASLFLRCDGERTLGQVLEDAGPAALPALLRLGKADVAALKILAKPTSQGGVQLNPAAESTMPYPEIKDARAYAAGGPAPQLKPDDEPTLAALFSEPHASLGGRTYAQSLANELVRRGAFKSVRGRAPRVLELELGFGLGDELQKHLRTHEPDARLVRMNPLGKAAVRADPRALPVRADSFDAVVANEIATYLGSETQGDKVVNQGALALLREGAAALAPGGVLFIADFGDPKSDPVPTGAGFSIRFSDLQAEATRLGLGARVLPLGEVLSLDLNQLALSTTKASWPALRALFAAHGLSLTRRAWLRSEIEKLVEGKIDLASVHGLQWAPLSERALGLAPKQFWALVAQKPERTLH